MKGIIYSTKQQKGSRTKYLDGLFANTGIAPSDDDDFASQVRNVVNSELGLWSEEAFDDTRVEGFTEEGESAGGRHVRRSLRCARERGCVKEHQSKV